MDKPNLEELVKIAQAQYPEIDKAILEQDAEAGLNAMKKLLLVLETAVKDFIDDIAYDIPKKLAYRGKTFCLSGNFTTGSKEYCAAKIEAKGGIVVKNVTQKVDYLIVGEEANPDWAMGNYGRKIERAMELREKTGAPLIIQEKDWRATL